MSERIKIVVAGDLFPTPINYDLFFDGKALELFGPEVLRIFKSADYSLCNLEGCFTAENTAPKVKYGPKIRASKECVAAVKELGIDCVSLANNHATDYGLKGLQDTISVLEQNGIACFGAGENESSIKTHYTVNIKGKRVSLYGVAETLENSPSANAPGVNLYDEYRVCRELRLLKNECDFLIVLYHGGIENIHYNTSYIKTRFHRMADNGADVVISQHTHAIGEEEHYNGSFLLYGQGNFCFHYSKNLHEWVKTGLILELNINSSGFDAKKHLIRREGNHIIYDEKQDLNDYNERTDRLRAGDTFEAELKALGKERLSLFLQAFRGKNMIDKIIAKLYSKESYLRYLKKHYSERQIQLILLTLQSEEFREVSSQGLNTMLEEKGK